MSELSKQFNMYPYKKTLLNTSCRIYLFVSALTGKQVVIMILIINESVVTQMPQLVIMMTYRFFFYFVDDICECQGPSSAERK